MHSPFVLPPGSLEACPRLRFPLFCKTITRKKLWELHVKQRAVNGLADPDGDKGRQGDRRKQGGRSLTGVRRRKCAVAAHATGGVRVQG